MPVTAKLSKAFYDRFGEEVVAELVEWFNLVDRTYRGDLRELNELNFARFDAKLEQRVVQLEAKIDRKLMQLEAKFDQKFAELDARVDRTATELNAKIDRTATELHAKIDSLRTELLGAIAVSVAASATEIRREMHEGFSRQNRFLYLAWATQVAATLSLWAR